jgi:MoxR-like ATPase
MNAAKVASQTHRHRALVEAFFKGANAIILDKEREITLTLCCLLADGHLLIEDVPGVGKTTLVKALARLLGMESSRIQFTNDLLPADILGTSVFEPERGQFRFARGPVFAQLVLADELNRATPKTQSACLQAMEERGVSVDGATHALPSPFFMIATQNPRQQIGTFALPESQLDRFLMRIELGFPSRAAERRLLLGESRQALLENMAPAMTPADLVSMQEAARATHASEAIVDYIQDIVGLSRERLAGRGISPRGALALLRAAKAWAFLQRREMVLPEDVQAVAVAVMNHRLNSSEDVTGDTGRRLAEDILGAVRVD